MASYDEQEHFYAANPNPTRPEIVILFFDPNPTRPVLLQPETRPNPTGSGSSRKIKLQFRVGSGLGLPRKNVPAHHMMPTSPPTKMSAVCGFLCQAMFYACKLQGLTFSISYLFSSLVFADHFPFDQFLQSGCKNGRRWRRQRLWAVFQCRRCIQYFFGFGI